MTSSKRTRRSDAGAILVVILIIVTASLGRAAGAPVILRAGFPASASAGSEIDVWVEVNATVPVDEVMLSYSNPQTGQMDYVPMNLTSGNGTSGRWSHTIPAQPWEGTLECRVTATDETGSSVRYPVFGDVVIQITGEEAPRPFPWNLVILVVFLGAALVLTELVFKPGLYRKTGRERARELEEEDRKREMEAGGKGRDGPD